MLNTVPEWHVSFEGIVSLPIVNAEGQVIACDGFVLAGFNADGSPFGPRITLDPVTGRVFDISLTANGILIILYHQGFLVGYLTSQGVMNFFKPIA